MDRAGALHGRAGVRDPQGDFGDRYLYAGLGTTLELGPKVTIRAEAGQQPTYAMDLEDVIDYRVALAHRMLAALADRRQRLASAVP